MKGLLYRLSVLAAFAWSISAGPVKRQVPLAPNPSLQGSQIPLSNAHNGDYPRIATRKATLS